MTSSSGLHPQISQDFQLVQDGELLTIRRYEPGKLYRGVYKKSGKYEEFKARCSFQPMSGRETLQLPEGDRLKSHVKVYSDFPMKRNDIIFRKGEEFEVQLANLWGTFTKSIARLIDENAERS